MKRVILAGGIGSGKSYVARILRQKGFGVFDCDYEARLLMEGDPGLSGRIRMIAGDDVYDGEGRLERKTLASRLFSDPGLRKEINRAVHAAVRHRIEGWLGEGDRNLFIETAIAYESGLYRMADEVWLVEAPEETRIRRVAARDGRGTVEIRRIMEAQASETRILTAEGVRIRKIYNGEDDNLLAQIEDSLTENGE